MSLYRGIRDFVTSTPERLRSDLLRLNQALEDAFGRLAQEFLPRWRVVIVTGPTYQAKHGECVLCGWNQSTTVTLPASTPATAGLGVRIGQVGGVGGAFVAPPSGQTVNKSTTPEQISLDTGYREYIDDGHGRWWGHLRA